MKKISQFIKESEENKLDVKKDSIGYISAEDLKKYLEIARSFLSDAAKDIINWLIVNNKTYVKDLGKGQEGNPLAIFYDNGPYREGDKKELYAKIGVLKKNGRILEVPVFLTKKEFDDVLARKVALDEIIMDFESEEGRNAIAKKYNRLCLKVIQPYIGKTRLDKEELLSAAYEGLTFAINLYGKPSPTALKQAKAAGVEFDISKNKKQSFLSYAQRIIWVKVLEAIKTESHLVSIPINQQDDERHDRGANTKSYSVSGDKKISNDENSKTLFDLVGGSQEGGRSFDDGDIQSNWDRLMAGIRKAPGITEQMLEIWERFYGINGKKKTPNKELAKEFNVSPSNITYICNKVISAILNNKKLLELAKELQELFQEARQHRWEDEQDGPVYVNENSNNDDDMDD